MDVGRGAHPFIRDAISAPATFSAIHTAHDPPTSIAARWTFSLAVTATASVSSTAVQMLNTSTASRRATTAFGTESGRNDPMLDLSRWPACSAGIVPRESITSAIIADDVSAAGKLACSTPEKTAGQPSAEPRSFAPSQKIVAMIAIATGAAIGAIPSPIHLSFPIVSTALSTCSSDMFGCFAIAARIAEVESTFASVTAAEAIATSESSTSARTNVGRSATSSKTRIGEVNVRRSRRPAESAAGGDTVVEALDIAADCLTYAAPVANRGPPRVAICHERNAGEPWHVRSMHDAALATSADPIARLPSWEELRHLSIDPVADRMVVKSYLEFREKPIGLVLWGLRTVGRLTGNSTYKKICAASYAELTDVILEQMCRNMLVPADRSEDETSTGEASGVHRPYNQLPCSRATLARRVALARAHCPPDGRVLVLGDDDHLSIELARAGFKDITVLDIDPAVLGAIAERAKPESLPIRTRVHDLRLPPPPELAGTYDLVCLDPMCTIEGLTFFLEAAGRMAPPNPRTRYLLCTHLMSLLPAGQPELAALLDRLRLDPVSFHPAINVYPLSPGSQRAQRWILRVADALFFRHEAIRHPDAVLRHFVSDTLILKNRQPL
jgi:hypothetical protein